MPVSVIVLCAGLSRRMGPENKLLLPLAGRPLYRYALELACGIGADEKIAVWSSEQVRSGFAEADFRLVRNPEPERGIASSVCLGTAAAAEQNALLFLAADQPLLSADTACRMVRAWEQTGLPVVPVCSGRRRGPCLFPPEMRGTLLRLSGDRGGRTLLRGRPVSELPVENEMEFCDADTPEQLARLRAYTEM